MAFLGGGGLTSSTPAKPSLFSGFGSTPATTTTAAPNFGLFGTTQTGNTATVAPSFFGGGGTATTTTTAPTFGGFGGAAAAPTFGASSAAPTFGASSAAPTFGVSSAAPTFGATSTAPTFGGFGSSTSNINAFGASNTQPGALGGFGTGSTFGANFGKPAMATVTPGFGGFGGSTSFMMGQSQQPAPQITPDEAFAQSIFNVSIYGDERDTIIAQWNYMQAKWGAGKSFYSQTAPPVEITPQNYLCRFKAMSYCRLPGKENKVGLVALNFNKSLADVRAQQQQIINTLNGILGNKPNLQINVEALKEHEEKKCQLVIFVEEKSQTVPNETRRILATELSNFLNQLNAKSHLNNLGVSEVLALVLPDEDQLKQYLDNPPKGIDPRMWRQANVDNPDPSKFIPVPMIGFNDLKFRIKCQEQEVETQALFMKKLDKDLADVRQRNTATMAKISECKRNLVELSHKVLKVIVKQECTRKVGLAMTPEEEALRTKLENMQALVSAPTQFKGRLNELLSQMRMQRSQYAITGGYEYTLDKDCEEEMRSFLSMQQKALEVLMDTITKNIKALNIVQDGMTELMRG